MCRDVDAYCMLSLLQLHGVSSRKCKLFLSCCAAGDLLNIFPFLFFTDDASSGKDSQVPEGSNGEYEDHSGKQWGKEQCVFCGFPCSLFQCCSRGTFLSCWRRGKAERLEWVLPTYGQIINRVSAECVGVNGSHPRVLQNAACGRP